VYSSQKSKICLGGSEIKTDYNSKQTKKQKEPCDNVDQGGIPKV